MSDLERTCAHRDGCDSVALRYGPYCGPHTAGWTPPPTEARCLKPLRCYCPREGCLGHPSLAPARHTPMPAELRAQAAAIAARYRPVPLNTNPQGDTP